MFDNVSPRNIDSNQDDRVERGVEKEPVLAKTRPILSSFLAGVYSTRLVRP